jgi:hypothetical protein
LPLLPALRALPDASLWLLRKLTPAAFAPGEQILLGLCLQNGSAVFIAARGGRPSREGIVCTAAIGCSIKHDRMASTSSTTCKYIKMYAKTNCQREIKCTPVE